MKTKIVYVLVSNDGDYYAEQTWCSLWSLKHFNKDVVAVLVIDNKTNDSLHSPNRVKMLDLVDEVIVAPVDASLGNMERSRWMKTNLRNLVDGDFLFIDGDTLITDDLSEVDGFKDDIMMSYDADVPLSKNYTYEKFLKIERRIFKLPEPLPEEYYNSGVIYCKDNESTHRFYDEWHERWKISKDKGYPYDQLSLYVTNVINNGYIKPLYGAYNCQITVSLNYLVDAKIMHFYSASNTTFTPFKDKKTFLSIKEKGEIDEALQDKIINCKHNFDGPIIILNSVEMEYDATVYNGLGKSLFNKHRTLFNFYNSLAKLSFWVIGVRGKILGHGRK